MIAANVDARTNAHGTLRRLEGAGKLLWLGVGDAVAAEQLPGAGYLAEPIFHLSDDEAAELDFGEGLHAEDSDGDEMFAFGSVGRGNLGDDGEIVDGAGAIAIEDEGWLRNGRFVGGVVEAGDAASGGFNFADKMGGGGAFRGDNDGAGTQRFAAGEGQFVLVQGVDVCIQTDGGRGQLFRKLGGDCAHARGGDGGIAFGQHFEDEFEHAAGGFKFAIEKNAAEEWTEEVMDELGRKTFGEESVLGGAFGAAEEIVDGRAVEARTKAGDAELVAKRAKVGTKGSPPDTGVAPRVDEIIEAAGIPGKNAVSERL